MKRLTYAGASFLVDDATADTLIDFAAVLSLSGRSRPVHLRALTPTGGETAVTVLLHGYAAVLTERIETDDEAAPENTETLAWMREEIRRSRHRPTVQPETPESLKAVEFGFLD